MLYRLACWLLLFPALLSAREATGNETLYAHSLRRTRPIRLLSPPDKKIAGSYREIPLADAPEASLSERSSDILQRQTGVQVNRTGAPGTQSQLGLRGSGPQQVEYFLEGIPIPRAYSAPLNLEALPLAVFRSVEIYPSFVPAHLPATNIGGALDFRLRQEAKPLVLSQVTASSLGGNSVAGAYARERQLQFVYFEQSRNLYRYPDNNGTPQNSADDRTLTRTNEDFTRIGYTGFTGFQAGPWRIDTLIDVSRSDRGIPGTQGNLLQAVRRREERGALALKAAYQTASGQELQLFASGAADRAQTQDPLNEIFASSTETLLSPQLVSGAGYAIQSGIFSAGIYGRGAFQDISRNGAFLAKRQEAQGAASTALDVPQVRIAVQAAANAFEDRAAQNAFYSSAAQGYNGQGVSGSGMVALRPLAFFTRAGTGSETPLLEIYGQVSSAYRPPSLYERFGDNVFVTPSQNLRSEKALTNTAGVRGVFGCPWRMTCSWRSEGWLTGARDYILFTQNSPRTLLAVNASSAQIMGFETEFALSLPSRLFLALRYTWLDARDYGSIPYYQDKFLPLRPRHQGVVTASYLWGHWRLVLSGEWRGAIYRDRYNSYQYYQASRLTMDAGIDYITQSAARHTVSFAVRNLTDTQITDYIGYPLPGRSVLLKWMVEL